MSNNTLLPSSDMPPKVRLGIRRGHYSLIASCSIALFGCMLINEGSVVTTQDALDDGSLKEQLAFSKPRVLGLGPVERAQGKHFGSPEGDGVASLESRYGF